MVNELDKPTDNIDLFFVKTKDYTIGDVNFVKRVKVEQNITQPGYVNINSKKLLAYLILYDRLNEALSIKEGTNVILFNRNINIAGYNFIKGEILTDKYVKKSKIYNNSLGMLRIVLGRIFKIYSSITLDEIKNNLNPKGTYNEVDNYYKTLSTKTYLKEKGIVEDFTKNFIGYKEYTDKFIITCHNIIRMIKQVKIMNDKYVKGELFTIPQAYVLTGSQGTGKSMLIENLFPYHYNPDTQKGINDPHIAQNLWQQAIIFDEVKRNKNLTEDLKTWISEPTKSVHELYSRESSSFVNSAIKIICSNYDDILNDGTDNGINRRWLVIPFPKTNLSNNQRKNHVYNFFKSRGCKINPLDNTLNVKDFFNKMIYTVLFTDEYKNINVSIYGKDGDINDKLISAKVTKNDVDIELEDFLNMEIEKINRTAFFDLKRNEKINVLTNDEPGSNFRVKDLEIFPVMIVKKALMKLNNKDISNYEIDTAMGKLGYTKTMYRQRKVFMKNK